MVASESCVLRKSIESFRFDLYSHAPRWLPSFKRQIIDGGAYSIMSAYSSYDGVPLIANHHILTDILRDEWGYKYWVRAVSLAQTQN